MKSLARQHPPGETALALGIREKAAGMRYLRALKWLKDVLTTMPGGPSLGEHGTRRITTVPICSDYAPRETRTPTGHTAHKALNLARLPIPPQARAGCAV